MDFEKSFDRLIDFVHRCLETFRIFLKRTQ